MEKEFYLKPNVVIEPLVDRWYAWSHLISVATSAMNTVDRHLKIMESFVNAPDLHEEAVKNPKMKGGPFMDIRSSRVEEIRKLFVQTTTERKEIIEFALAIKQLDLLLRNEPKGFGLENLYPKIPERLRGLVELYYDRNNNAGFRFFESLLYSSKYYNIKGQSIALWITNNDERPFCLSTPRLNNEDMLNLAIPFNHKGIDELAKMKRSSNSLSHIENILTVPFEKRKLFQSFFTEEEPSKYNRYLGDKIRMRYFGHACILVETKDISILVDPLVSYYGYHSNVEHFSDADLPNVIDYVMITHNHQDHILLETLLPLRHKVKNLVVPMSNSGKLEDPDLNKMFKSLGFSNVISIDEMESVDFGETSILSLPFTGEHSDLNIITKSCYLVQLSGFKLLFMADSRIIESKLYENIHAVIGDVDVIFLGMECDGAPLSWLYGPLMTHKISRDQDNSRRLAGSDFDKGMKIVNIFSPKEVYVYAMGQEPWVEFISSIKYTDESNPIVQSNLLIQECVKLNIVAERLYGEKELLYSFNSVLF